MIESQLRALYEQTAGSEPPPSLVDPVLARQRGRTRYRWRRAGIASAPVLAAAAVAAVILATGAAPPIPGLGGAAPSASRTPVAGRSQPPGYPARAPRRFNPLIPYASFGWLPAGLSLLSGGTGRAQMYLTAGPEPGHSTLALTVYSADRCQLTHAQLSCAASASGGQTAQITGNAPAIHGHRAYWADGYLAWQYARHGWAWLSLPARAGSQQRRIAAEVADHVRYGLATVPLLTFPAQLTGVPRSWQVSRVRFVQHAGVLRASQYALTAGPAVLSAGSGEFRPGLPFLTTDPATAHGSCYFYPHGQSTREVINGFRVTVNRFPARHGSPPEQQLCAASADGLAVFIAEIGGHPAIGVAAVFEHLLLLGTHSVDWTRAPIG
ncbi:MAG TPA: hypothetical protein VMV17_08255 [Streptosporangiaceae bacterium]|nr:hypothetical protein [Streptosporangiaceae bacterium]